MAFKKLLYKGVFWRSASMVSFFMLNLVIARSFGAAASGQLFFLINAYALGLLAASVSGEAALGYYSANKTLQPGAAALAAIVWAVIAGLLCWGLAHYFPALMGQYLFVSNWFVIAVVAYVVGYMLIMFFTALFAAQQNFVLPNLLALLTNLCLLLFFVNGKTLTINLFAGYFFIAFFVQGILLTLCFLLRHSAGFGWPGRASLTMVWRYALRAFVANLLFFLVYRVDYWLVDYFTTDKALMGSYIQVSKLAQVFFIVPGMVATTVFSVAAAGPDALMDGRVQRLGRFIFTIVLLPCLVLTATGWWLFPWLFGHSFIPMYPAFVLLVPGILAIASLYPYTALLAGQNKVGQNIQGLLLALLVILVGDWLLVRYWHIYVAAAVSSIGYVVYYGYIVSRFNRASGLAMSKGFIMNKSDWRMLMVRSDTNHDNKKEEYGAS